MLKLKLVDDIDILSIEVAREMAKDEHTYGTDPSYPYITSLCEVIIMYDNNVYYIHVPINDHL